MLSRAVPVQWNAQRGLRSFEMVRDSADFHTTSLLRSHTRESHSLCRIQSTSPLSRIVVTIRSRRSDDRISRLGLEDQTRPGTRHLRPPEWNPAPQESGEIVTSSAWRKTIYNMLIGRLAACFQKAEWPTKR
jgi:hypothetical protein